jgi:hypothetical protein
VLEVIAALRPDQVRSLRIETPTPKWHIAIEPLTIPGNHKLGAFAASASFLAMEWTERRGWATDSEAGGHYYHGCYFDYSLVDPHWLSAMRRAMNAAALAALGDDVNDQQRARVLTEWIELIGP